jgi:hypothetical protein
LWVLAAALHALAPRAAFAQQVQPGDTLIPIELATVLLGGRGAGDILVGDAPDDVRRAIPLDRMGRLVGTYQASSFGMAVLATDVEPAEGLATAERALEGAGWTRARLPEATRAGGFQGSRRSLTVRIWCSPDRELEVAPVRARGAVYIRLSYRSAEHSVCSARSPTASGRIAELALLPSLYPPEGADARGGGVGGSPTSLQSQTPIDTELSVDSLVRNFETQLIDAGWEVMDAQDAPESALHRYRFRDDDGRAWVGALILWRVSPGTIQAELRLVRVEDQQG